MAWGKWGNAGQAHTPDYVIVHSSVKERFQRIKIVLRKAFGDKPETSGVGVSAHLDMSVGSKVWFLALAVK